MEEVFKQSDKELERQILEVCGVVTPLSSVEELTGAYGGGAGAQLILEDFVKRAIDTVNLKYLTFIGNRLMMSSQSFKSLDIKTLGIKSNSPSDDEVASFIFRSSSMMNELQMFKEEVNFYIGLFKQALNALKGFKEIVQVVVKGQTIFALDVKPKDRAECISRVVVDLDQAIDLLDGYIKTFARIIDEVLSPRQNIIFKMESSLRLLSKFMGLDYPGRGPGLGAENRSHPVRSRDISEESSEGPEDYEESGFEVEKVVTG